ncbi:MAG: hypothetical protein RR455_12970 [Bacteroidales bacterium]
MKFKIGEIEFEADGSAELVERERMVFLNEILPAAIDAVVRTRAAENAGQYIEISRQPISLLAENTANADLILDAAPNSKDSDYSQMNLASYLNGLGTLQEQEFALFSAYFYERKNGTKYFTKDDLEKYYAEARRTKPSNISMSLNRLAEKGFIMDAVEAEPKVPKPYIVSNEGIRYIQTYKPKEATRKKTTKLRKTCAKAKSSYSDISTDELNLDKYPEVKSLKKFKEKMLMVLYIITNEKRGEWFTAADVLFLMVDVFGEFVTIDQVAGVFKREKSWFKVENVEENQKETKRKLLNKGLEFALALQLK